MYKWKHVSEKEAKEYFKELFNAELDDIVGLYWNFNKYLTKVNDNVKYFWKFLQKLSSLLIDMKKDLITIDICIDEIKYLTENKIENSNPEAYYCISCINSNLLTDKSRNFVLKLASIFDDVWKSRDGKTKTLLENLNFGTFINDFSDDLKNKDINIRGNILNFNNKFIEPLAKKVNFYRPLFNYFKHNLTETLDNKFYMPTQLAFNFWYILENFIRPILLTLFRMPSDSGHEYILMRSVDYVFPLEKTYKYISIGIKQTSDKDSNN